MTSLKTQQPARRLPMRRRDLVIKPSGDDGRHVVKDPRGGGGAGAYFSLGAEESFLLMGLDGRTTARELVDAFERRFEQPLTAADLREFLNLARTSGFLEQVSPVARVPAPVERPAAPQSRVAPAQPASVDESLGPAPKARQSILYWRKAVYDPDRLFNRLEPWLGFVWTVPFAVVSATMVVAAIALAWVNRWEIVSGFAGGWNWRVVLLVWLTLTLTTTLHEFAHGLTCKHFGGEVHEIGFLLMFFMPCFYCNVSDAWLFRERGKRLLVTFAGGYFDVCLWAAAVFAWRLTAQDTLLNYLAWAVIGVCGARIFFNLNPLLKLDGYYLLSDAAGIPNLRQRALEAFTARVRWLLWGAPRPAREPRGRFLFYFGAAAWAYALVFLSLLGAWLVRSANARWGVAGASLGVAATAYLLRGSLANFTSGEVGTMISKRRRRAAMWGLGIGAFVAALLFVPKEDLATGPVQVRSSDRVEVRAPVAGFLRAVSFREGDRVAA